MKKLIIAVMMFGMVGVASASHVVSGVKGVHLGTEAPNFGGVVASVALVGAYVMQSNAQGVLPCHSRPDVKIDKGGYVGYSTDCEVNGFK